ncbi:MAG: histidine kinase [Betaproteobacteria bacterium]|nr:histidine kinase [Betaproteobacteria bacterium]
MFRKLGDVIHNTPWWAMILLGVSVLLLLVAVSVPTHVMRLSETGATPEERRAIKREIDRAVGDSALGMAENIVRAIKERSNDPTRRVEMERALEEIANARQEIYNVQRQAAENAREIANEAQRSALETAREAQRAAMESAIEAANGALEAATEARVAVEEAKQEAADKLKSTGANTDAALRAFDDMINAAKDKEKVAREELRKLKDARKRGINIDTSEGQGLNFDGTIAGKRVKGNIDLSDGTGESGKSSASAKSPTPPAAPASKVAPPAKAALPAPPAPQAAAKEGVTIGLKVPDGPMIGLKVDNADDPKTFSIDIGEAGKKGSSGRGELTINGEKIALNMPVPPMVPLPPELRETIKSSVQQDVRRIGVGSVAVLAFIPMFIMMLIAKFFIDRSRRATAFAEQKKQEAEQSNVNRQIVEARLQALQAQVEPHFLYNTLANVQALTEVDPNQANQMTGHLIQYLRNALPKMRESTSTVGQEIELVRAFLNILKMRMGDRLDFGIDCAEDLLKLPFPPMMLPSLVENAIKHGLEPQREGGRINVIVTPVMTALGKRVRIEVKDTGKGLSDSPTTAGTGVGLTNIRERLIALFGEGDNAGKLTLESNDPKGVIATLEVPVDPQPAGRIASLAPAKPEPPKGWWGKTRYAIATTHGVWAKIMSKTFIVLMIALAIVFGLALAALYTGLLPFNVGDIELGGLEGMAMGTVLLIAAFGVVALVLLIVVGLLYGLGLLFAGLLIIIPLIILISVFPAMAPFILVGGAAYWWFVYRKKKSNASQS